MRFRKHCPANRVVERIFLQMWVANPQMCVANPQTVCCSRRCAEEEQQKSRLEIRDHKNATQEHFMGSAQRCPTPKKTFCAFNGAKIDRFSGEGFRSESRQNRGNNRNISHALVTHLITALTAPVRFSQGKRHAHLYMTRKKKFGGDFDTHALSKNSDSRSTSSRNSMTTLAAAPMREMPQTHPFLQGKHH